MENGRRAPLSYRNIKPASNSMANSQFVNARDAPRLNTFLFHYSFTKTSKEGGGSSPRYSPLQDVGDSLFLRNTGTHLPHYLLHVMTWNTSIRITNNCPCILCNMANGTQPQVQGMRWSSRIILAHLSTLKTMNGEKKWYKVFTTIYLYQLCLTMLKMWISVVLQTHTKFCEN